MLRIKLSRAALVALVAGSIPLGTAAASTPDGSEPPTSEPATSNQPTSDQPDTSAADESDGGSGEIPVDIEFQVDMMLGLVPEDEMNEYYQQDEIRRQEQIQACMNEAGFEFNVDTNNGAGVFSTPARTDAEQLDWARQWGFGQWTTLSPESQAEAYPESQSLDDEWVDPNPFVQEMSESEQNAWYEQQGRCSDEVYNSQENDPWRNPMVQQAMLDFQTWIENDPTTREAEETWRECMEAAGQPFASQDEMYQAVYGDDETGELWSRFYQSSAWEESSPDHEEWQSLVDNEIAIAVASAECSPPLTEAYQEVSESLRPRLIEAWQDVDWDLPPVTYPGEGDIFYGDFPGDTGEVPVGSEPGGTSPEPVALDLSSDEPTATTAP